MGAKLTLNKDGSFRIHNVDKLSYTYFPLCNDNGLKGSITPSLNGSLNIDQNSFFLLPTSNEDAHNSLMNRNVYFQINDTLTWSITGNTPSQLLTPDEVTLDADFLVHKITRKHELFTGEIESFVGKDDTVEYHKLVVTNTTNEPLTIKPVLNVPMYSRSADNLRDHRHVSALLNRLTVHETGMTNQPTFLFDERGHHTNENRYDIQFLTTDSKLKHYWPILEEFIGEGHTLMTPKVVTEHCQSTHKQGDTITGYEMTGGFEFETITLKQNETFTLYFALGINSQLNQKPLTKEMYEEQKIQTKEYWKTLTNQLETSVQDDTYSAWLKWVSIQPTLRRLYGNSFLPHHDYGKGGRGWRDLWQDQLSLILMDSSSVRDALINNFKGVRVDGSNATIIGDQPGEFKSDRNNIPRVWMDHGSWPLLTTKLYIDKTGDSDILFENVSYFDDEFTHYTKQTKTDTRDNLSGTILEHLLIQNIVPYYNVGDHGNIRLEDADWNDGLDMASDKGESIAFTALYGSNLIELADILKYLKDNGHTSITLLSALDILLGAVDKDGVTAKQEVLNTYFDTVSNGDLDTKSYPIEDVINVLTQLGESLLSQVRENEFLSHKGEGWFNGYYDNDGNPIDNIETKDMTLTPQVFTIMSGAATTDQIKHIIEASDRYLYDPSVGGYRLNTDFKEVKTNMGRLFGFGYGHKENGAMFSHMAVMYANALYQRGYIHAGRKVLSSIYSYVSDVSKAKMYPGLPEYVDARGRGMYPYLTGSASWYLLTLVTEVFGIKGHYGDLVLTPKLTKDEFTNHRASIKTMINNKSVTFIYQNEQNLAYGDYQIKSVNGPTRSYQFERKDNGVIVTEPIKDDTLSIELEPIQ